MSERISESELARFDQDAANYNEYTAANPGLGVQALRVRVLVAEVRRLRGLIVRLGVLRSQGWMANPDPDAIADVEAEARAIRDEHRTENGTG